MPGSRPPETVRDIAMETPPLYLLPLWANGLLFVAVLLTCMEGSFRLADWRRRSRDKPKSGTQGDVVPTAMLGLLGLMLAFTYAYTVGRYDNRKAAVLHETNAIGTAFLRADLLSEPSRSALRNALLEYARTRPVTHSMVVPKALPRTLARMSEAQAALWPVIRRMTGESRPGPLEVAVVQSVNEVLDAHTRRLVVGFDHLPSAIQIMLLFVAGASMAVAGYSAGRTGSMQRWRMYSLALSISAIIVVITDFDRPMSGFIRVNQDGYHQLIGEMEKTRDR